MMRTMLAVFAAAVLGACGGPPGPEGPPGPQGPQGPTGLPGVPSASPVLSTRNICFADHTFGNVFISAAYRRYNMADGSAMVTCYIYHNSEPQPAQSITLWYAPYDLEIKDGLCAVGYDLETPGGGGGFEFVVPPEPPTGRTVTYYDSTSPHHGAQLVLTCFEI